MSTFEKLAPFIQDYIYRHNWQELHEVQVAACDIIFNTDHNLLIATPTASGKTEAAFLPIMTEIYNRPSSSVGILYIAPLKALINDQFLRIEELLEEAYIPVTKWHGDASLTAKKKLIKKPQGVLQITPESLESMLMQNKQSVLTLFSDLRFIIIDEVHNFIASDRGIQLSSLLERIQNLTGNVPRRVGLSATMGDLHSAGAWLSCGTGRQCSIPDIGVGRRKAQIMLNHFYTNQDNPEDISWVPYYELLYSLTKGRKCIIFSNSRSEVEQNINHLKLLAESKKEYDVFHVHHGNISADGREYAEEQMRKSGIPAITGATITLELGIDLGDLERIVQTGTPHSVSSLAQRLGRSGRRNGISQMYFVFNENTPMQSDPFYRKINWHFVKCIALIEQYRKNWLEPLRVAKYPFNILVHQTLSFLYGYGDITPGLLAQKILSEQTFRHIDQEDFRTLLIHMAEKELIEKTQEGKIQIGKKGEWLTNHYEFYTVFENPVEYAVCEGAKEVGTLYELLPVGETFVLSGKTWEVLEANQDRKVLYVKYIGGKSTVSWDGRMPGEIHTKVLKKMREVIVSDESYGYLHRSARDRLSEIRDLIKKTRVFGTEHKTDIIAVSPNRCLLFPWLGTSAFNALKYSLQDKGIDIIERDYDQIYLTVTSKSTDELYAVLKRIQSEKTDDGQLVHPSHKLSIGKYGEYVPYPLAVKQYNDMYVDKGEMKRELVVMGGANS
ncbi:MAG: DEAD/DEAH box helicase [Lachnoclostridium sp.]|jgi:ATP-dependent Lhr-like helicase|nr:DEAD/DEAH box helicase [Lachnoclostridium sp.]